MPGSQPAGPQGRARVLVVNAGSSSMKLSVAGPGDVVTDQCDIDRWDGRADQPELRAYLGRLDGQARPPDVRSTAW
jgi:hypothetical protein